MMSGVERLRKYLNFEMYQVYIISIYLSSFFLFDKQLNVFVYTEKKKSVSF